MPSRSEQSHANVHGNARRAHCCVTTLSAAKPSDVRADLVLLYKPVSDMLVHCIMLKREIRRVRQTDMRSQQTEMSVISCATVLKVVCL